MKIGSICSGIEAASVAWGDLGNRFCWFSEIAPFQARFLATRYPNTQNIGDLLRIPREILDGRVECPDVVCGGTPCQAFSVTGRHRGLADERGQLTLKFIEVVEAADKRKGSCETLVFWENVEGVLKDKTNAFGCFLAALAGCDDAFQARSWPTAGLVRGPSRNVAWRVLDAKYFGVPQQRRRLYVVAGGKGFKPENVLFERHGSRPLGRFKDAPLRFEKNGKRFEVFRSYTDCLYSAYGTKWNGNAAAYNGSLFVAENDRLRRLTPLEAERLMGFPDNYTDVHFAKRTSRFQATGNSWAVPVVKWIGKRLFNVHEQSDVHVEADRLSLLPYLSHECGADIFLFDATLIGEGNAQMPAINVSPIPEVVVGSNIADVIDTDAEEGLFVSPVGCGGILRRARERGVRMNLRLEAVMRRVAANMEPDEIERISRLQPRGAYSMAIEKGGLEAVRRRRQAV